MPGLSRSSKVFDRLRITLADGDDGRPDVDWLDVGEGEIGVGFEQGGDVLLGRAPENVGIGLRFPGPTRLGATSDLDLDAGLGGERGGDLLERGVGTAGTVEANHAGRSLVV